MKSKENKRTTWLDEQSDSMVRDGWSLVGDGRSYSWQKGPLSTPLNRSSVAAAKRAIKRAKA